MSEQREGREAIIDILIEHNVGVLNTHGYSDMVEKLEALFSPDAGALEEARELTFAAFQEANVTRCLAAFKHGLDDWSLLEWAGAAAGEMGEVANVCKKLLRQEQGVGGEWAARDPERNELLQALADEIGDTVAYLALLAAAAGIDIGQASASKFDAVSDKVSWDGVRLAALHTGSEPADEAREHVGRALMYVSRALESPEVCASVNRETGGSAPELVQGLLDRITEIWATREAPEEVFACPNCAVAGVSVDEDGLCVTCGVDAPVFTLAKRLRSEAPALREALEEIEPMAHGKWGDHTPLVEVLDRIGRIARRALREAGGEHG